MQAKQYLSRWSLSTGHCHYFCSAYEIYHSNEYCFRLGHFLGHYLGAHHFEPLDYDDFREQVSEFLMTQVRPRHEQFTFQNYEPETYSIQYHTIMTKVDGKGSLANQYSNISSGIMTANR